MVILVNLVILGESGNFNEYVVSCKSRESGNLNVFGDFVAIFVNVVILVGVAILLSHVIFEKLVDLIFW